MTATASSIESDIDLFSDENLANPWPAYKDLRDRGPATYLTKYGLWFLSRYEQVRYVLQNWREFSSAEGAGLNPIINEAWSDAIICVDPPTHTTMKQLFMERLGPRQMKPIVDTIDDRARQLVDNILTKGSVDAVSDIAMDLPVNVIMDLVGWPESERDRLLEFAAGSFDCCGPENERMQASMGKLAGSVEYVTAIYDEDRLQPGTFGHTISQAAREGHITKEAAIGLLLAYVVAAFDTTINAISSGLWLFAQNPDQWQKLRADPSLVTGAINETLRMESPIQFFSRVTTRDVDLGEGVVIPAGARTFHSYGAGNRDERKYPDPDRFDITRNPADHLAFGGGVHSCAGQNLAKLEATAVFKAMAERIETIELAGEPTRGLNNFVRGLSSVPITVS